MWVFVTIIIFNTKKEDYKAAEDDDDDEGPDTSTGGGAKSFFGSVEGVSYHANSFLELHISRPLLRACEALGYTKPTPIQVSIVFGYPPYAVVFDRLVIKLAFDSILFQLGELWGIFSQAACIPLALTGRDICGSAVTGSGKV